MTRTAKCLCGSLAVTCEVEPVQIFECHCHDCQRRTGSPMAVIAYFPNEALESDGEAKRYLRIGDAGSRITHYFCPNCGTTLFYEAPEVFPGLTAVPVGCFNDSNFPEPKMSFYGKRRYHWLHPIEGAENFDEAPEF